MYTIWHNPRCSKSRAGLEILKNSGKEFEIREYLKEGENPEISELQKIQKFLGFTEDDIFKMVRVKESFWKEEGIDIKSLSEQEILELLVKFPRGIERPILIKDNKVAVMGRPPENFLEIL